MADAFKVKSRLRAYEVRFVKNCAQAIGNQKDSGNFLVIDADFPGSAAIRRLFPKEKIVSIKAQEKAKTLEGCTILIKKLVARGIRRNQIIYAVGGGVIEDMTAFVSTILYRGIPWVFVPTTLLAQADSCIGSKSSINLGTYKNLLGSFYPPSCVLIDVNFLKTLPPDQVKSGIGEILHFYLVAGEDKRAARMMAGYQQFVNNPLGLRPYIVMSLRIKKAVIEKDEFDQRQRQLFNYGHTFGHAIESVTNYKISHGQAVTMGMDVANYLSWRLGHIDQKTFEYMHRILKPNCPLFQLSAANWPKYVQALSKDKKNTGKALGCILTKGPGRMFRAQLPMYGPAMDLIREYWMEGRHS